MDVRGPRRVTLSPLMESLLDAIEEARAVSYAALLDDYDGYRPCFVASELQRLRVRELVCYSHGLYSVTDKGKAYLDGEE